MDKKRRIRRTYKIVDQLGMMLAILIVVPIIILGIYMYVVARNNLNNQTKIAMEGNTGVIANGIENNCKRENDVIKFFSYEENFRRVLEHSVSNQYSLTEELNSNIEPLIWYYLSSDSNIESIMIYTDLIAQDHIGDFLTKPKTEYELKWYETCKTEYSAMWVTDDEGGVYVIKALLDGSTSSKLVGVVALKVNSNNFFSMINQGSYLDNGLMIVDEKKQVIVHKKIENQDLDSEITGMVLEYGMDNLDDDFMKTDKYFMSSSKALENGWRLFYYVDRSAMVSDVFSILTSDIILAAVLFVISYVAATYYARKLGQRIDRLNKKARYIRKGKFDVVDDDTYRDEIGQLSESMVGMANQLKAMMEEINKRNEQDLLMKDNDIHYREWLFDFVVEKNNDILVVLSEGSYEPDFITANAQAVLGIPLTDLKADIRNIDKARRKDVDNVPPFAEALDRVMRTGDELVFDEIKIENVKTNEHLYYRVILVCTIDDGGKRIAFALYDRTQEYKRNHQLQEALNAAETANKAKTSFLANMSHDFRTPMNAITGYNLLIDKHAKEVDKVREYTHKISLSAQNLLSLLNDVLDMSKIESGKTTLDIKEMAIGLLLEEINSVISLQAKAKSQVYIVNTSELIHDAFLGDKQRINEILVNILGNAVKYTPEGGRIEFTIIESASSSEGFQNVKFIIKDNGIGMKPEYKDKIFDAFSREEKGATKTIQGTGLGMAITKSLVELMGGTIRVDSEEGKGSTFTVNLRLQVVEASNEDFWNSRGISTFLGVNKSAEENESFRNKLENEKVLGTVVCTGFDALKEIDEKAKDNKHFDFILIDETIEDMTPQELIKSIRGRDKKNNSIIFVALDNIDKYEDEVKAAGCNEIIKKPVMDLSLHQAVDDVIQRSKSKEEAETNPLEGMKFLAAEDNDINADILMELMDMEGATVTRGCNGQEVVELFKQANEGDYDMILMDIQMPVMNGYEAAAAIRALGTDWSQRIPIIAMTANAYADDVQQAFDAGMNAHVTKPIDIRIVEKTILEFKGK
jgi:signal transduction histidine kinase/DNA-binding response OmpR family regulator